MQAPSGGGGKRLWVRDKIPDRRKAWAGTEKLIQILPLTLPAQEAPAVPLTEGKEQISMTNSAGILIIRLSGTEGGHQIVIIGRIAHQNDFFPG